MVSTSSGTGLLLPPVCGDRSNAVGSEGGMLHRVLSSLINRRKHPGSQAHGQYGSQQGRQQMVEDASLLQSYWRSVRYSCTEAWLHEQRIPVLLRNDRSPNGTLCGTEPCWLVGSLPVNAMPWKLFLRKSKDSLWYCRECSVFDVCSMSVRLNIEHTSI
jgi:hypothetical protein